MKVEREVIQHIRRKLEMAPAVVILGARQVGKTTLALQLAESHKKPFVYIDLHSHRDAAMLGDEPETFFDYHLDKLIICATRLCYE